MLAYLLEDKRLLEVEYNRLFGGACSQFNITVPAPGINTTLTSSNSTQRGNATVTTAGPSPIYINATSLGAANTVTSLSNSSVLASSPTTAAAATTTSAGFSAAVTTPSIFLAPTSVANSAPNLVGKISIWAHLIMVCTSCIVGWQFGAS